MDNIEQDLSLQIGRRFPVLICVYGEARLLGRAWEIPSAALVIGNDQTCDIQLNDPAASDKHVFVHSQIGDIVIEDLNSESGTYINEEQLPKYLPQLLIEGDHLRIGKNIFVYYETSAVELEAFTQSQSEPLVDQLTGWFSVAGLKTQIENWQSSAVYIGIAVFQIYEMGYQGAKTTTTNFAIRRLTRTIQNITSLKDTIHVRLGPNRLGTLYRDTSAEKITSDVEAVYRGFFSSLAGPLFEDQQWRITCGLHALPATNLRWGELYGGASRLLRDSILTEKIRCTSAFQVMKLKSP